MNEYYFKYYKSKYIFFQLILFAGIIICILSFLCLKSNYLANLFEKNIALTTVIFLIFLLIILFIIIKFGLNIFSKNVRIIMTPKHININYDERIIEFSKINDLILNIIKDTRTKIITSYELKIIYDINRIIKLIVFTGMSIKENKNCDTFLKFYNEMNRYNELNKVK